MNFFALWFNCTFACVWLCSCFTIENVPKMSLCTIHLPLLADISSLRCPGKQLLPLRPLDLSILTWSWNKCTTATKFVSSNFLKSRWHVLARTLLRSVFISCSAIQKVILHLHRNIKTLKLSSDCVDPPQGKTWYQERWWKKEKQQNYFVFVWIFRQSSAMAIGRFARVFLPNGLIASGNLIRRIDLVNGLLDRQIEWTDRLIHFLPLSKLIDWKNKVTSESFVEFFENGQSIDHQLAETRIQPEVDISSDTR